MSMLDMGLVACMVSFAVGYYLGERGLKGVQIDMNNVKTDVEVLKGKVSEKLPVAA